MRVALCLPDEAGCGHYRIRYPGRAAEREGVTATYLTEVPLTLVPDPNGGPPSVGSVEVSDVDVLVLQRPLQRIHAEMIRPLQQKGIAVVVDIDDDFSAIVPPHVSWRHTQPQHNLESNRDWLRLACRCADLVTCTTPALAERYGRHGRVTVLPNFVPEAMLDVSPEENRDGRTVGWAGHVGTHPGDLDVTHGGVAEACRAFGARFRHVGNVEGVQEGLHLRDVPVVATGPVPFDQYPKELARFDVGIVPLADTVFNRAKSALKGLEYAAVGVPFVASSTCPDYVRIADDGIGLLAKPRSRDWRRKVALLLDHPERIAERTKDAVRQKYTYEQNGWRWVEAWEQAVENAHAATKVRDAA